MKIVIAPDKFKGSLTSLGACLAIREGIQEFDKNIQVEIYPMSDGGDGFAEILKFYLGTVSQILPSVNALGREISCVYEWQEAEQIAIIELASCSGLAMLDKNDRNPLITSTYGTGLQIKNAVEKGAKKIILGVGGSATNDAGIGILYALGFRFLDLKSKELKPCGENLLHIKKIIPPTSLLPVLFEIACDVTNPLYGANGAAFIFAPQKGADPKQVELLDRGLQNFASLIQQHTGKDVSNIPGSGAAGGIAAGLMAYFEVNLVEGTQVVIQASKMKETLYNTNLIITGEGKIDNQTFYGKTITAIVNMGKKRDIPVIGLCGKLELKDAEWKGLGLSFAAAIHDGFLNEDESIRTASPLLKKKIKSIMPFLVTSVDKTSN
jgi:glycerate kinase